MPLFRPFSPQNMRDAIPLRSRTNKEGLPKRQAAVFVPIMEHNGEVSKRKRREIEWGSSEKGSKYAVQCHYELVQ